MVAALYVDRCGPYDSLPGVELWDEHMDARRYPGPFPVVAHPPCAEWGRLRELRHSLPGKRCELGILACLAVIQVRRWGGVLEHPAHSALWRHMALPKPGELPDEYEGITVEINQAQYGHACTKATWLYFVRCSLGATPIRCAGRTVIGRVSRFKRRRTPIQLARALVDAASTAARTGIGQ